MCPVSKFCGNVMVGKICVGFAAVLAAVGLIVLIDQLHQVALVEAEVELVGAGAGQQKLVDAGAVEIGAR